jgi:hypothetical protein
MRISVMTLKWEEEGEWPGFGEVYKGFEKITSIAAEH